jgi:hypothetical protein
MKASADEIESKRAEASRNRSLINESLSKIRNQIKDSKLTHARALREALQTSVADAR